RDRRAEGLAVARRLLLELLAAAVLADRDVFHLRRDDAGARIGKLRHGAAGLRLERPAAAAVEGGHHARLAGPEAVVLRTNGAARSLLHIAPGPDPSLPHLPHARADVDRHDRVAVGSGGVVDTHREFLRRGRELDLA